MTVRELLHTSLTDFKFVTLYTENDFVSLDANTETANINAMEYTDYTVDTLDIDFENKGLILYIHKEID